MGRMSYVVQNGLLNAAGSRTRAVESIIASGLFDLNHYASAAGLPADLELCVQHYLKRGARAGINPHRLFDGASYLERHPDVAKLRVNPFLHFINHGLAEGRQNTVPRDYIDDIRGLPLAALAQSRVLQQAQNLGWTECSPSPWQKTAVAVYASSLGNFFMRDIADRIADGLRSDGIHVYRLDQNSVRPADTTADVVVAPHEFFHLGGGKAWLDRPIMARAVMLNTEQPGTKWYFHALSYTRPTATILDMSPQSAVLLRELGRCRSGYLPVGWTAQNGLSEQDRKPVGDHMRGLESWAPGEWNWSDNGAWQERPIDVLFYGTLTPRRGRALSLLAPTLAQYRCFIHAPTLGRPLQGGRADLGIEESRGLARQAKIMLNLHRDELPYFEWHRMMSMGIERGALVVSEPCLPTPGVEPQRHYLTEELRGIPALLHRLLRTSEGQDLSDFVRRTAANELPKRFNLRVELRALAHLHETQFGHA